MLDWKKARISKTDTLEAGLKVLESESLRVALVVDDQGRLQGLLTDGDIRRALLRSRSLNTPILEAMNSKPVTIGMDVTRAESVSYMRRHNLSCLPRVDNDGKVVDLETLYGWREPRSTNNPVLIMAGGYGARLRSRTADCPKPMLKVGGKPVLERIIENFQRQGFWKFHISTHYLSEQITDYFGDGTDRNLQISYVIEPEPMGTGGAISLLPDIESSLPLIVMNGDLLVEMDFLDLIKHHNKGKNIATIVVRNYEYEVPFGVIETAAERISGIAEKPKFTYKINSGIYVLNGAVQRAIPPGPIDMPRLLTELLEQGSCIGSYRLDSGWLDIGHPSDLERANDLYFNV